MPSASSPFSRPSQLGVLSISVVHWVSASTNTRSKNSSRGVTCSLSRITALTCGTRLDGALPTTQSFPLQPPPPAPGRAGLAPAADPSEPLSVFPHGAHRRLPPQL